MDISYTQPRSTYSNPMYTQVVSTRGTSGLHFFAGRCAQDPNGNCVSEGDLMGQFLYIMKALTRDLAEINASWGDVVFRRIYTTDVDACLAAEADPEVLAFTPEGRRPASTLLGVTRLADPRYLIEIEITAAIA